MHPFTYYSIYPSTCLLTHLVIYPLIHPIICHSSVSSWSMPCRVYIVIQGHIDVIPPPKELTIKKPPLPVPPPFTKGWLLTSLSQLNISGRMGLASTVQTMSTEPPIFTSVGSWRARMMGASGGSRGLGKAFRPRQAMVGEGLRWEKHLRGLQESYECDIVYPFMWTNT